MVLTKDKPSRPFQSSYIKEAHEGNILTQRAIKIMKSHKSVTSLSTELGLSAYKKD